METSALSATSRTTYHSMIQPSLRLTSKLPLATGRIAVGLVTGHELAAPMRVYPPPAVDGDGAEADDIHRPVPNPFLAVATGIRRGGLTRLAVNSNNLGGIGAAGR